MKFRFDPLRATQAAAVLAQHAGVSGRINYTKLLKLLYLADRKSLIDTGRPITGDEVVNLANGPVLSSVYDCIKGSQRFEGNAWNKHFRKDCYDVVLSEDPGIGELSDYDLAVLKDLAERYRTATYSNMIDIVHSLKEWKKPEDGGADWVPYEEILRAEGFDEADVKEYQSRNEAIIAFEKRVSSAAG